MWWIYNSTNLYAGKDENIDILNIYYRFKLPIIRLSLTILQSTMYLRRNRQRIKKLYFVYQLPYLKILMDNLCCRTSKWYVILATILNLEFVLRRRKKKKTKYVEKLSKPNWQTGFRRRIPSTVFEFSATISNILGTRHDRHAVTITARQSADAVKLSSMYHLPHVIDTSPPCL